VAEGTFPFYTLFLEIDPKHIDINVHPTKTEIKFDDERTVYAIVKAAVRQALGTHNITPALDFRADVNFASFRPQTKVDALGKSDRDYSQFKDLDRKRQSTSHWEQLYEGLQKDIRHEETVNTQMEIHPEAQSTVTLSSAANTLEHNPRPERVAAAAQYFQIHKKYIATHVKSGLWLIAQQEAHERILYERFLQMIHHRSGASQQTLFPQTLELNPSDYTLVMGMKEEISAIGFEFAEFGKNTIVINGVPADLKAVNEKLLFEEFVEQFKLNEAELSISADDNVARAIAKRSSLKVGATLTPEEMSSLIDQLFGCKNPNYSPNGKRTTFIMELEKIDQFFN
jgi:DNA mismatch repair protein MutL